MMKKIAVLGLACCTFAKQIQVPNPADFFGKRALRLSKEDYCNAPMPEYVELAGTHKDKQLSMVCWEFSSFRE